MSDSKARLDRVAKSLGLSIEHDLGPWSWRGQPFSLQPTPTQTQLDQFFKRCRLLEKRAKVRSTLRLAEKERQVLASLLHRNACQSLTLLQLHCDLLLEGEAAAEIGPLLRKLNHEFRKVYDFLSFAKRDSQWLRDEFGLTGFNKLPPLLRRALLDYLMAARARLENFLVTKRKREICLEMGPQVVRHRQALTFLEIELVALGAEIEQEGQQIRLLLPSSIEEKVKQNRLQKVSLPLKKSP